MSSSTVNRRGGGVYRRAGLTVALALVGLAVVPAVASAAAVSTSGTVITFTAASGETNNLTVTHPGTDTYLFNEASISITESSANCTAASGNVTCSGVSWTSVVVSLGDNGDTFTATGVNDDPFTIDGGSSGDTITGSSANDILYGGSSGSDDLNGDAGNDRLDGGDNGEEQDDDFDGGNGIDRVVFGIIPGFTYTCTSQAVNIDMDNTADDDVCSDGSSDNNNVRDSVESVTGSTLGDTITGSCFANTFAGDPGSTNGSTGGADTLNGDPSGGCTAASGSTDFLGGAEGNDTFDGDGLIDGSHFKGLDTVTYGFPLSGHATTTATTTGGSCSTAGSGFAVRVILDGTANDCDGFGNTDFVHTDIDRLIGSGLADDLDATGVGPTQGVSLFGRLGNDTLTDGPAGDFLNGEGGADAINCPNGGTDTYVIDASDTVTGSCEIGT